MSALGAPQWLRIATVTVCVLGFAAALRFTIVRTRVGKRPVLLAGTIVGMLPAIYLGFVWAGVLPDVLFRLTRPWLWWLTPVAATFVGIRLSSVITSPWRGRFIDGLTMASAIAIAMAATGPEIAKPLDRLTVLVAVDRSRSIDLVPNANARIRQELAVAEGGMRKDDRIGVIAFAAEAATEDPPRLRSEISAPQTVVVGRDGTDLAAAMRRALAEVPPSSAARIVLLSDGVATRGDTMGAASAAVAAGVPVDVVALEQRARPDVRVVGLQAPPNVDEGEAMDLRLVTASAIAAEIEVRVRRDGDLITKTRAKIAAGEDVLHVRDVAKRTGLHRYDVEVTALDPGLDETPEDNTASAFVRVRGEAIALVLEGDVGKGGFITRGLQAAAFRVVEASASGIPADVGSLAGYDLVVLSDIRASEMSPGQLDAFASYVRNLGGGLILTGGDRSMGPGGYSRTAIEDVSPVSFDRKQDQRRASLAEVIGIDISGSMGVHEGKRTKLELANEAAARSAALLGSGDRLGVAHVDTVVRWSVPLGPLIDAGATDRAIRGVGPGGGGIYVDITLDAGYAALARESVNLKHMLLFADGSDAERMAGCREKVSGANRRGITTSVVALGKGSDVPELEVLSRLGGGRFYLIEDAARLPAVFAQETILAARSSIVEQDFQVTLGAPSSITAGINFEAAPGLKGLVVTIAKLRASVLLRGIEGDPVLAVWSAGLGRTAAFTSDLKDRWGQGWMSWPGASQLVAQLARDVSRKSDDPRVRLEARSSDGELHLQATVVGDDGRSQSFQRLVVRVAGPGEFMREIALEAVGAGTYAASTPLSRPGAYIAVARDEGSGAILGTAGAVRTEGEELRPTGSDLALLGRIVELTHGKKRDTLAGVFRDRSSRRFAYEDVAPDLFGSGAFLYLFAIATRRLALPRLAVLDRLLARLGAATHSRIPPAVPAPTRKPWRTLLAVHRRAGKAREAKTRHAVRSEAKAGTSPPLPIRPPLQVLTPPHRSATELSRAASDRTQPAHKGRSPSLTTAEIVLARRKGNRS